MKLKQLFGSYTVELKGNQIVVTQGKNSELLFAKDIKNINFADEEFKKFVDKFEKLYQKKYMPTKPD